MQLIASRRVKNNHHLAKYSPCFIRRLYPVNHPGRPRKGLEHRPFSTVKLTSEFRNSLSYFTGSRTELITSYYER